MLLPNRVVVVVVISSSSVMLKDIFIGASCSPPSSSWIAAAVAPPPPPSPNSSSRIISAGINHGVVFCAGTVDLLRHSRKDHLDKVDDDDDDGDDDASLLVLACATETRVDITPPPVKEGMVEVRASAAANKGPWLAMTEPPTKAQATYRSCMAAWGRAGGVLFRRRRIVRDKLEGS
jgi:hypothetical protein